MTEEQFNTLRYFLRTILIVLTLAACLIGMNLCTVSMKLENIKQAMIESEVKP